MGNTKILKALLNSFVVDMPARIEALGAAINHKGIEQTGRLTHLIRGLYAKISGLYLQSLASELKQATLIDNIDWSELFSLISQRHPLHYTRN